VLAVEESSMLDEATAHRDEAGRGPGAPRLAAGFAVLVALFYALIVLGALVRAHGAGLACPDWPLCFGAFVPQMDLRVAFEWSHRAFAGSITLGFAALAAITWPRTRAGDPVRRRLALAASLLTVQIVLGALTVWLKLASWTVTAHLVIGNAVAATFAWTALELRARRASRATALAPATPGQRRALAAVLALLAFQLVLGGLVSSRYAGLACPEWPTCNGGFWFPSWRGPVGLHLLHRSNGYLLLVAITALASLCRASPRLARWTRAAEGLAAAQVAVGIANVLAKIPIELTGLHSALAAALVLTATGAAHAAWGSGR
jgi:cytochrome c oxidase assembly protein subunit 15